MPNKGHNQILEGRTALLRTPPKLARGSPHTRSNVQKPQLSHREMLEKALAERQAGSLHAILLPWKLRCVTRSCTLAPAAPVTACTPVPAHGDPHPLPESEITGHRPCWQCSASTPGGYARIQACLQALLAVLTCEGPHSRLGITGLPPRYCKQNGPESLTPQLRI